MRAAEVLEQLRAAPVVPFETVAGAAPVLVLAPHPDDESLGCGGLIAEACARGQDIHVAILTDGSRSHPDSRSWPPERLAARRAEEAAAATAALGLADPPVLLGLPDSRAPHEGPDFAAALARLDALIAARGIETVVCAWRHDPHGDHGAAAKLAAASRAARLWSYPVWAWTLDAEAMLPDCGDRAVRLDIAVHLPAKRRAIQAHASQHGRVVDDDPGGFVLPAAFLALFDQPFETFIRER